MLQHWWDHQFCVCKWCSTAQQERLHVWCPHFSKVSWTHWHVNTGSCKIPARPNKAEQNCTCIPTVQQWHATGSVNKAEGWWSDSRTWQLRFKTAEEPSSCVSSVLRRSAGWSSRRHATQHHRTKHWQASQHERRKALSSSTCLLKTLLQLRMSNVYTEEQITATYGVYCLWWPCTSSVFLHTECLMLHMQMQSLDYYLPVTWAIRTMWKMRMTCDIWQTETTQVDLMNKDWVLIDTERVCKTSRAVRCTSIAKSYFMCFGCFIQS